ncbi:MAG: lantibiotic dehydratase C-terminal domain-containing protein, partial [Calditrichota bacterium]
MQQPWHSYHLHLQSGLNQFLSGYFLPAFEQLMTQEIVKRFFYIRFSEGGMHLRMRFQLDEKQSESQLEEKLVEAVDRFLLDIPVEDSDEEIEKRGQLVKSLYDRKQHYFGNTMTTVYAELMNERTSYIA